MCQSCDKKMYVVKIGLTDSSCNYIWKVELITPNFNIGWKLNVLVLT